MKHLFSLIAMVSLVAVFSLSQTGCTEVYAVGPAPAYGPYAAYGGAYYGGAGFYRGAYYGSSAYWNNGYGRAYGVRGGYASWNAWR